MVDMNPDSYTLFVFCRQTEKAGETDVTPHPLEPCNYTREPAVVSNQRPVGRSMKAAGRANCASRCAARAFNPTVSVA